MVDHKFPQLHRNATGVPHCQTHPNIIRFVAQVSHYIASISPFYHLYLIYPQHLPLSPHKSHENPQISEKDLFPQATNPMNVFAWCKLSIGS